MGLWTCEDQILKHVFWFQIWTSKQICKRIITTINPYAKYSISHILINSIEGGKVNRISVLSCVFWCFHMHKCRLIFLRTEPASMYVNDHLCISTTDDNLVSQAANEDKYSNIGRQSSCYCCCFIRWLHAAPSTLYFIIVPGEAPAPFSIPGNTFYELSSVFLWHNKFGATETASLKIKFLCPLSYFKVCERSLVEELWGVFKRQVIRM